jgi:catechol 2,3-dioxygenase-like lactoylglutathione lyase family enzyme
VVAVPTRGARRRCKADAEAGGCKCHHHRDDAPSSEGGDYSRHRIGLQHISFYVPTRADVDRVHDWARERDHEIVHEPKLFPEYNERFYATFFLDMHGFMLEVVTYEKVDDADA